MVTATTEGKIGGDGHHLEHNRCVIITKGKIGNGSHHWDTYIEVFVTLRAHYWKVTNIIVKLMAMIGNWWWWYLGKMKNIDERFEIFNLESNKEVDFNFPLLLNGKDNEEEDYLRSKP